MLDFDEIRKNAEEQGISLSEIAILYENLDPSELHVLETMDLLASRSSTSTAVGRFTRQGEALFPQKATGVLHLGA